METEKLIIYIAGPMRGYFDNNFPAFFTAEKKWAKNPLVQLVINPARLDEEDGFSSEELLNPTRKQLREFMQRDLNALLKCDAIYMLRGWERSDGAKVEHALAIYLGLLVFYEG